MPQYLFFFTIFLCFNIEVNSNVCHPAEDKGFNVSNVFFFFLIRSPKNGLLIVATFMLHWATFFLLNQWSKQHWVQRAGLCVNSLQNIDNPPPRLHQSVCVLDSVSGVCLAAKVDVTASGQGQLSDNAPIFTSLLQMVYLPWLSPSAPWPWLACWQWLHTRWVALISGWSAQ